MMPTLADEMGCWIITNPSQSKFHLYGNDPEEIQIEDIANALSKQCRWTGHLIPEAWFSVAEHSVLVSKILKHLDQDRLIQFQGLMHDTPEAYLSDINAPFKREMPVYYEKEALIWHRIATKFNLPRELHPIVKKADWLALYLEAREFLLPNKLEEFKTWPSWEEYGKEAFDLPVGLRPIGYLHMNARTLFLDYFAQLS